MTRAGTPVGSLTALALQFTVRNGFGEQYAFLRANPQLVSEEGVQALHALAGAAQRGPSADAEGVIDDRVELLARCVEIGVDAAFLEQAGSGVLAPASVDPIAERVNRAQQQYLNMRTRDAADAYVEAARTLAGHPDLAAAPAVLRARLTGWLGRASLERYSITGDGADLERGLAAVTSAIELIELRNPDVIVLAGSLVMASARTGDADAANRAVALVREALRTARWRDAEEAELQSLLCIALRITSESGGGPDLAAEAADAGMRAVRSAPAGSSDLTRYQGIAGQALWVRYNQTGDTTDLVRALELLEAAADGARGSPLEATATALFANAVRDRYLLTDDSTNLDLLVRLRQRVVELARDGDEEAADNLSYLGVALHYRFLLTGSRTDLDAAIEYCERAVRERSGRLKSRMICDVGLAVVLRSRWDRDGDPGDLDRVVEIYEGLLDAAPAAFANGIRSNLAHALAERAERDDDEAEARRATRLYRESAGTEGPGTVIAVSAALRWALRAMESDDWEEAAEASQAALAGLSDVMRVQRTWGERSAWLQRAQGVPRWAAYSLAKLGRPWDAVLALESGRTRWLAESLQLEGAELDELGDAGHADLRDRYLQVLAELADLQGDERAVAGPDAGGLATRRRAALAEREDAIAAIRAVPGYEDFGRAPRPEVVREAAAAAPVCYLVAARAGGVAFIVRAASAEPEVVWLPLLTDAELSEQSTRLVGALATSGQEADETVHEVTYWMWDAVMAPVLDRLDGEPEVCLIPTSWLSFCPLHAAATVDDSAPSGHRYAIDRLRVTYAASARARRRSLELVRDARPAPTALVVADPQPTSAAPLPSARFEADAIRQRLPATVLAGADATRENVGSQLGEHAVLHFACHGAASLLAPLSSRLLLAHDEPLFLEDLLGVRLNARLAVLSACESAMTGGIVDEAVALPTGLLQAGAVGSVATMWSVSDASAALLMTCFYAEWMDAERPPAEALRSAQRWLRDTTNDEKVARFPECRELVVAASTSSDEPWGPRREYGHPGDWAAFALFGV